jgi:hypothetical protein
LVVTRIVRSNIEVDGRDFLGHPGQNAHFLRGMVMVPASGRVLQVSVHLVSAGGHNAKHGFCGWLG